MNTIVCLATLFAFSTEVEVEVAEPVNALIANQSWVAQFGTEPKRERDNERIRVHLEYVEDQLSLSSDKPLSISQMQKRRLRLNDLRRYIERGKFPTRSADAYIGRRPRFIDDDGTHCAVGFLLASSENEALAQKINAEFEYAYVHQMKSPELLEWANDNGFSLRELAMIQPSYPANAPTSATIKSGIDLMKNQITEHCASFIKNERSVSLRVTGDKNANVYMKPRYKRASQFTTCFADELTRIQTELRPREYGGKPTKFSFSMRVLVEPNKEKRAAILQQEIKEWTSAPDPLGRKKISYGALPLQSAQNRIARAAYRQRQKKAALEREQARKAEAALANKPGKKEPETGSKNDKQTSKKSCSSCVAASGVAPKSAFLFLLLGVFLHRSSRRD